MGTNFYVESQPPCPTCRREYEQLHIGKSSAGWCFSLRVYPEKGINTLEDWRRIWSGNTIRDEYGSPVSETEMLEIISQREWKRDSWESLAKGYGSEYEFHRRNYSQRGPNGLLRHKLGSNCIGHGDGTYDLIEGEFF